ncbi:MAG: VOC family protein [Candidatus Eisenbacteria bacterium]|uniref:VOC family protein n=1 Tax=Eiseniibacteriota bacterium TaxID=2212470 RepID=A0A538UDQ0_UNCEI|nr:MAG: VOC family protein [Candidatus Eisenbacteria bacterium]
MPTITRNAPGSFCWPELGTTDQTAAKTFYGALFGWTFTDHDTGPNGIYTIFQLGGRDAAALYTLRPDMMQAGVPPHWGSYVAVLSADEAAAKAKQLGGTVIMQPFDASENGRMAVIQDPIGATFSVWQANKHDGIGVAGEPGSLAWSQLNARQPAPAKQFYTQLFGWKAQDDPMPMGGTYTTLLNTGTPIGGIMPMPVDVPAQAPSHWLNYFASADVDASVKKATGLGGKALVPGRDIPGVGRFAVIQDPQGAVFAVVRFAT